jgi:8-oxo-dGTP diphosphatase
VFKYTICFIKNGTQILLLNRNKKPNMGSWNGVGGKIEPWETPYEGIVREVFEETGLILEDVTFTGNVKWKSINGVAGMYVFIAEMPSEQSLSTPLKVDEGILDWKEIEWILDENNIGVVSNIKWFLPRMLAGEHLMEHTFVYEDGMIREYMTTNLDQVDVIGAACPS